MTGMSHEHQRIVRDEHVLYKCENIPGFVTALYAARNTCGAQFSQSMLCDNM